MSQGQPHVGGLGALVLVPWLLGWTVGVVFIEWLTISEPFSLITIFAFSHGGAEVATLRAAAQNFASFADTPPHPPDVTLDHDGLVARWRRGSGNATIQVLGGLFFAGIHAALLGGAAWSLSSNLGQVLSWLVAAAFVGVWGWTGLTCAQAVRRYGEGRGQVVLEADLDEVVVTDRGVSHRLRLKGLMVAPDGAGVTLDDGDHTVDVPCKPGKERDDLLATLRLMAGRATVADPVPEPPALARMRAVEGTGS